MRSTSSFGAHYAILRMVRCSEKASCIGFGDGHCVACETLPVVQGFIASNWLKSESKEDRRAKSARAGCYRGGGLVVPDDRAA